MTNKLRSIKRNQEPLMTSATLKDILTSQEVFNRLANERFTGRTSLKFMKLSRMFQQELDSFDKVRTNLCHKFSEGKILENGNYDIPDDKREEFNTEFNEMLKQPVEFPLSLKCSLDEITVPISGAELLSLSWLIDE